MQTLRSHTHLQAGQAETQIPSLQKSMPALTHGQKDIVAKMKENLTRNKNNETLTGSIFYCRVSPKINGSGSLETLF